MPEEKTLEVIVNEVLSDLQKKINDIKGAAQAVEGPNKEKVDAMVNKVSVVLVNAANKVAETAKTVSSSEELEKGIEIVKTKSKELYDYALAKIDELKQTDIVNETIETVKQVTNNVVNSETVVNVVDAVKQEAEVVRENVNEFLQKPEVKETIEEVKVVTVEMAEKALATLKEWLKTDGDNQ